MKIRKQRIWLLVLSIVVAISGIGALGATVWYKQMLSPVDVNSQQTFRINIKEGMGSSDIAKTLEDNKNYQKLFSVFYLHKAPQFSEQV